MSNLIVEMEMPQACPCDLIGIGYAMCCSAANSRKRIAEYDECVNNGTRPDWCPIKGVLPDEHGDLIDRDELKEKFCDDDAIDNYAREYIDAAQIIIAAERKDDE